MSKYLLIGDLHMREKLGYSDFIPDGRKQEEEDVLNEIVKLSKGCDKVIFMGDQMNGRNNPSSVIKKFVKFLERFNQEIFILGGNHDKSGDGSSSMDFLKEIKGKKWHLITNEVLKIDEDVFCPFFYKGELECDTYEEATEKLMSILLSGENLFIHHAISGHDIKGIRTDELNEIVLPRNKIIKKYKNIFCGHLHNAYQDPKNNILYTGSIFSNEVNENDKFVYTIEDGKVTEHLLPGRRIIKLENPTFRSMREIPKNSIIKIVLDKKPDESYLQGIKEHLNDYEGSILVEDYKTERKKIKFSDGELNLEISNLLNIYAKEKNIDLKKLQAGYELIK
jgi:DNA repair exonuclease SbcCD nuclease subunit